MLDFITQQEALGETYALNETLYSVYAPSRFDHRKLGDLISESFSRAEAIEAAKDYFATMAYEDGTRGEHDSAAYIVINHRNDEVIESITIEYECGGAQ